ncbi:MAG: hypothetical protein Q7R93_03000 [bacterium]|nr:hypothetical protein [bacterium]
MRTSPTARTEQPRTFYRPSFTSLMGGPEGKDGIEKARPEQFDVVSCAWVLKETIGSGSAQSYFPECAKMNGVIKDGVTAQNVFLPIFAWIEKLKQGSGAAADGLAAVATGFGFLK